MGGEKRWPLVEGPPISVGRLVLMLTTVVDVSHET